jgi:hypothetical protein
MKTMKAKILITVIALFTIWNGFAQSDLLDKFSDQKGITQVSITKALLNMVPNLTSSVDMNGVKIGNIINKLDQIDIFTTEENSAKQLMRKEFASYFKNNKSYDVLMKIKDESNNVVFYGQKDGNFIKSMVMFADSDNECVIICLLGKFTTQDIQTIVDSKGKK